MGECITGFRQLLEMVDGTIESLPPSGSRPQKIGCTAQEMRHMLSTAYAHVLGSRGLRCRPDAELTSNVTRVAKWMTDRSARPSILLWGECGNGKTTMLNSIREVLASLRKCRNESFFSIADESETARARAMLEGLPDPFAWTTATKLCYIAEGEPENFRTLCMVPMLIVDDAGSEPRAVKRYGTDTNPFTEMIYERYEAMLPTVISSNLSPDRLTMMYGQRVGDRLREMCEVVEFKGKSYRR